MGHAPGLDALHRGIFQLQLTLLDQIASDGLVRLAVLVGVSHAHQLARGQPHPARALNLQKEQVYRVVHPEQYLAGEGGQPALDLGARVIRHHAPAFEPSAQAQMLQLRVDRRQIDGQQVIGRSVDRILVRPFLDAAAAQQRFVVTSGKSLHAAVGVGYPVGLELRLEELAHRGGFRQPLGQCAALVPGRLCLESGATAQKCRPCGAQIVVRPARQVGPAHRLQGLRLGQRGRGRRAYRADGAGRNRGAGLNRRRRDRPHGGAGGEQREQHRRRERAPAVNPRDHGKQSQATQNVSSCHEPRPNAARAEPTR